MLNKLIPQAITFTGHPAQCSWTSHLWLHLILPDTTAPYHFTDQSIVTQSILQFSSYDDSAAQFPDKGIQILFSATFQLLYCFQFSCSYQRVGASSLWTFEALLLFFTKLGYLIQLWLAWGGRERFLPHNIQGHSMKLTSSMLRRDIKKVLFHTIVSLCDSL